MAIRPAATLILDGVSRAVTLAFPVSGGHWEGDGCDVWWVDDYDYLHGTLSYTAPAMANGSHAATLTVTDTSGSTNSQSWSFTVSAPPTLLSSQPASGAAIKGSLPVVSATLGTNGTISTASLRLDGASFPGTWNPSTRVISGTPSAPLPDGKHTATVLATDTAGLTLSASWDFTTINNASTVFSTPQPAGGGTSAVWNPRISVTCSDTALLTGATMQIDGAAVGSSFQLATGGRSGTVSFQSAMLSDGVHTAKVTATNNLGFSSAYSWSFTVAAPPQVTISAPANGGWATSLSPTITATVADNGAVASAAVTVDGLPCSATYDSATKTVTGLPIGLSDDASHTVSVQVTDAAGNVGTRTASFRTHATLPAFSAASPAPGGVAAVNSPVVSVSTYDAMGMGASPTMLLDGKNVACQWNYLVTGGQWVGDGCDAYYLETYDYTRGTISLPTYSLSNGVHTATVRAANAIGGASSYTWSFSVGQPPRLASPVPASDSFVATLTPTLTTSVASNATISSVSAFIDGVAGLASYDPVSKTLRATPLAPLADDAVHTVLATAYDNSGLSGSLTWTFKTHTAPPVLSAQTPAPGSVSGAASPSLAVSASDWSGLDGRPTMTLDGVALSPTWDFVQTSAQWVGTGCDAYLDVVYDYTRGRASAQTAALRDGMHTVSARVTNNAGSSSTSTWTFTVSEPPKVTGLSPSAGSWVATLTPIITASVTDNSAVATVSVLVDGMPSLSMYDAVAKTVRAVPLAPLADDVPHTVLVMATDTYGVSASATWSFNTHSASPTLDTYGPAPATSAWNPNVFASTTDISGFVGQPTMMLDGVAVPATWANDIISERWVGTGCDAYLETIYDYTRGRIAYQPANLPDGRHTAVVQLRNAAGTPRTISWSFDVQSPPRLSDPKPSGSAWVTTQTPSISLTVAENSGVGSTWATIDGKAVGSAYDSVTGRVRVLPTSALDNDADHQVVVGVTDTSGNSSSANWKFHIQTFAPMPGTGATDCTSCHTTYPAAHPMANCEACHGTGGPVEDCRRCHGYGGHGSGEFDATDWAGPYPCTRCHQASYAATVPMHPASESYHDTSRDMSPCKPCHVTPLPVEHYRYKDASGASLTCATCHNSTDARVRNAISSHNTDCSACHDFGNGSSSHVAVHDLGSLSGDVTLFGVDHQNAGTISYGVDCGMCHDVSNISALHGNRCATCHPNPRNSFETWGKGCQQGDCHRTYHANATLGHLSVCNDYTNGCLGCHEWNTWAVTPARCGNCHSLVDHQAPTTTSDAAPTYLGPATITLKAADTPSPGGSGVASTHYLVDGGPEQLGTVVRVPGMGSHTLEFWSVDGAGNTEPRKTVRFTVTLDSQPPTTRSDAKASYYGTATITLVATDDGATKPNTFYRLDGAATATGTVVIVGQPATGSVAHTLEFWSVDAAGNAEARHNFASFTVALDSVPPITSSNLKPFYRAGAHSFVILTAGDAGSGVAQTYYRIDNSPVWTGGIWLDSFAAGAHTLTYWSVDRAGNQEAPHSQQFYLDGTGPTTLADCVASMPSPATVHFLATDNPGGSGVASTSYRLDGGATQVGGSVTVYRTGSHTLEFWSVDNVGNVETTHKYATFNVAATDFIAPVTTSDATATYSVSALITLSATDDPGGSGVETSYYKIDGGAQSSGTAVYVPSAGTHTVEYWSVDRAGNIESPHKTVTFNVTMPPDVGTIRFGWDDPPDGSWTYYYVYKVYDASGHLIATGYNETGWFVVNVPVSSTPYVLRAYWYCPGNPTPVWSDSSALVDTPGKVVTWFY